MKIQVGIYQDKETIANYLHSLGREYHDIMEVGPFPSRLQAVEWMDFLGEKCKDYEMERFSSGYMNGHPWYGFTFE